VCRLQRLRAFASVVNLGSQSGRTHEHIMLSRRQKFPNLEGQVLEFISPVDRVALAPAGSEFTFRRLRRLAWLRWRYSNPDSTELHTSPRTNGTENVSSSIACSLVAAKNCPLSCFLAKAVVLSPVYTAVTWQWVCMSQYL
jgi:hypothetical protein